MEDAGAGFGTAIQVVRDSDGEGGLVCGDGSGVGGVDVPADEGSADDGVGFCINDGDVGDAAVGCSINRGGGVRKGFVGGGWWEG